MNVSSLGKMQQFWDCDSSQELWTLETSTLRVNIVDLLCLLDRTSHTVEPFRNSLPLLGHLDHASSIQHPIAKQVVELKTHSITLPLMHLIMESVPLGGQDCQVLHVPPG